MEMIARTDLHAEGNGRMTFGLVKIDKLSLLLDGEIPRGSDRLCQCSQDRMRHAIEVALRRVGHADMIGGNAELIGFGAGIIKG